MDRRHFLKSMNSLLLLAASGAVPGLSLFARHAGAAGLGHGSKFFVMIRVSNGWDVTLGLDPQAHRDGSDQSDMFIEYQESEILSAAGLRLAPACAPLVPYANELAVLNGVFMSDSNVSHEANLDYISTGNSEGMAADLPVEFAALGNSGPFGVIFGNRLKRGSREIMPSSVSNMLSLRTSLNLNSLKDFLDKSSSEGDFRRAQLNLMQTSAMRAELIEAMTKLESDISSSTGEFVIDDTRKSAAAIAASFSCGAAMQGVIDISAQLDSHSDHEGRHLEEQTKVWTGVSDVFRIFKSVPLADGSSLFDNTTFMVVSEFARTPALNASKGKDHNPLTNSVLLAGAGIRGGTTFGGSRKVLRRNSSNGEPRHAAGLVDFSNGRIALTKAEARAANFQFLFPENIAATVAEIMGIDRARLSSVSPTVSSIALLKKT